MKTIIIGSGMSGLVAGAYLAQAGHEVVIFEQYPQIGGVTATVHQDGFGWDLGPLLLEGFEPGGRANLILRELEVVQQVPVVRDDRGVWFPDFELWRPVDYAGPYWRRERLKELFPDESQGLDRYYRFYDRMADLAARSERLQSLGGWRALAEKLRLWMDFRHVQSMQDWSAQQVMDDFFQGPELKALYTAILADFVVQPSQFPGLGVPLVNYETAFDQRIPLQVSSAGARPGYGYIRGGCEKLVAAVAGRVRACGGRIYTNASVEKILIEKGRARGVRLADGRTEQGDVVIASGAAQDVFFDLIGREHLLPDFSARLDDLQHMESVFMVHLGVDMDPSAHQPGALCYYYRTYDIESGVHQCRQGVYHEGEDGFLIYTLTDHSPELAPAGRHAVTIYTIAPNQLDSGTWTERREAMADKLVDLAEAHIPGLREHTVSRRILTPDDFKARTGQRRRHSFGGLAPVMGQKAPEHRTPIEGLWFVGAQSESGGGVPNVMTGARKAALEIMGRRQ